MARRLRNTGSSNVSEPLSRCPLFHSTVLHSTLLHSVMCLSSRHSARSKNVLPASVSEESAAEAAQRLRRGFSLTPPPILPDPHTKTLENKAYLDHFDRNSLYFGGFRARRKRHAQETQSLLTFQSNSQAILSSQSCSASTARSKNH